MSWASRAKTSEGGRAATAPTMGTTAPISGDRESTITPRVWSQEQDAIFSYVVDEPGHLVVQALAGTGKTTTIVEAVIRLKATRPELNIIVCAFNKRIAEELVVRFTDTPGVEVKTLHAVGFSLIRKYWSKVKIDDRKRGAEITDAVCDRNVPDTIKKLVTKLHTKGREITPLATRGEELDKLAEQFDCDPDDFWYAQGYNVQFVCNRAAEAMAWAARDEKPACIDFADMIFLPVRRRWAAREFDVVVVDEAQDMTMSQLMLAQAVCGGRFIVVGDPNQAIYGFRGADSNSLARLRKELDAPVLTLNTTYRCAQAIAKTAQRFVKAFTAGVNNPEGVVDTLPKDALLEAAQPGDFILSRINAPLASTAMALLRRGKRTRIAGRDIGQGLKGLVQKFAKGNSVPAFLGSLAAWETKQIARYTRLKWEAKIAQVQDQAETLRHLALDAKGVDEITNRIDWLFDDAGQSEGMITCSSVHKAKGLESSRVFVLAWTLRERDQEELNIQYVAVTRAKTHLTFVTER